MAGVIGALEEAVINNPLHVLSEDELESELIRFCSFFSIIHNKKLNSVAIFTLIVQNKIYKKIFMRMMHIDNEREALLLFLKYNSNLCRSKVVKEVLKS
jgi:hypothetical protein